MVLPYLLVKNPKSVYFPPLPITKSHAFWDKAKKRAQLLSATDDRILSEIEKEIPDTNPDYSLLTTRWRQVEREFWKILEKILPDETHRVFSLEIRPTHYGSVATGYSLFSETGKNGELVVYVRIDMCAAHIAEAILIDLVNRSLAQDEYSWEEIEGVIDFLLTHSGLGKAVTGFVPTLQSIRNKTDGKYIKDSTEYLKKLGFKPAGLFEIKNKKVYIDKKEFIEVLTPIEERLLIYFIEHKNVYISNDIIAEIIWDEDSYEKYSHYAIAKHIQRLREKIEASGLSPTTLQTFKKRGYILID